jgi:uncharacterized protein (DUF302 family)
MEQASLYRAQSSKSVHEFIESVRHNALKFGFRVHEIIDMKELYKNYGVNVVDGFKVYSITLCNPQKSYKSITQNPERNAVILEQKQIVVYDNDGYTTVNYLPLPKEFVREIFPDDQQFAESLHESCQKRIKIIEASK